MSGVKQCFHTVRVQQYEFTVPVYYTNLHFIKKGGQGEVISAEDARTEEMVAIKKIINPVGSPADTIRVIREIALLTSVRHPNIIDTFSVFSPHMTEENLGDVYVVMELMQFSLSDVIDNAHAKMDHKKLSSLFYQVLCGVNHLHREEIIHRDLKPCNIGVNRKDVKVLDFGLARLADASRMSTYVVTRHYRAPELLLVPEEVRITDHNYTNKVDVWSIGCIFAEIITGAVLFKGSDSEKQWKAIMNIMGTPKESFISRLNPIVAKDVRAHIRSPKPFKEIIPDSCFLSDDGRYGTACDARRLIAKMLAIDPNERCSVAEALEDPYVKCWHRDYQVKAPLLTTTRRYDEKLEENKLYVSTTDQLKTILFNKVKELEHSFNEH